MAKIKLTKPAVDAAKPQAQPIELRDTLIPGFLCKIHLPVAKSSCSSTGRTPASGASLHWVCTENWPLNKPAHWHRVGWLRYAGVAIRELPRQY